MQMKHKHLLFRIIFTSLFTLTALLCCRAILYLPKPIEVSFTVEAEQPIAVKLYWKNNATGKFSASLSKVLAMQSAKEDLTFIIPEREIHSLRIDPEDASGKVTISNITLHSGRTTERLQADRSLTAVNIGALTKAENRVSIVCDRHDPQLIYKTIFRSKHRSIDVTMGCIVLILSLCFSLYLSRVIRMPHCRMPKISFSDILQKCRARFTLPGTGWYNVLFCCIFFIIAALPVIHFNKAEFSMKERRPLSPFPVLKNRYTGINLTFGTEFNDWLQDHSGFKNELIRQNILLNSLVNNNCRESGSAIMYANGWAFFKPYYNCPVLEESVERNIGNNLQKLHNFCAEQGTRLYIVVCPTKEVFYQEHNLKATTDPALCFLSLEQRMKTEHPDVNIIHPIKEMEEVKAAHPELLLHYKLDTHINEDGARVIYDALYKRMQKDFPDLPPVPAEVSYVTSPQRFYYDKNKGQRKSFAHESLHNMLMLGRDYVTDTTYRHYSFNNIPTPPVQKQGSEHYSAVSHFEQGKHTAYMLGDSSSQYLFFWAQLSFRDLCRYRANNGPKQIFAMKRWENELRSNRPDALIICVSEGTFVKHFLNLY